MSTETTIVLRGRCVVPGRSEGEALVTHDRISGWGGIDSRTGTIVETRHELRGLSFAGKVLVSGRQGSSGWSNTFHLTRVFGRPASMLFNEMTSRSHSARWTRASVSRPTAIRSLIDRR
jgi:predicted aconitase with swiveling domain